MKKEDLKELNSVIQVCDCGKVDAYKDDGHNCEYEMYKRLNNNN
jgi:hypothetical protein